MMKKYYIAIAAAAVCFASCNKEAAVAPVDEESDSHLVQMTFKATTVDTKTTLGTLSAGQYPVIWSDTDAIKVIAVDGEGATLHTDTFTIDAGGSSTASFTGTTYADAAAYYAVYPASLSATIAGTGDAATVSFSDFASHDVLAVDNGFDPARGALFAASEAGVFTFKHAMVYFKLTVSCDGVESIELSCKDSDTRIYGNPKYKFSDGSIDDTIGSASKANNYITLAPASGTLTKGATYYIPVIAKNRKFGTLKLTYSKGGSTIAKTTSKLSTVSPVNGTVYDLGTPPITFDPVFSASDVDIEAADEAGTIDFTVSNLVDGGVVSKEVLAGATIDNLTLGAVSFNTSTGVGSVSFTCDENTDSDPKTATVRLTYTYNTDQTVTKDVTITQKKASGGSSPISYAWDFSSSDFSDANAAASTVLSTTASANSNTPITWDYIGVDLTYIANKSTYNGTYIQTGGNGSASSRCFSFTAPEAGTLTLSASSNGSSTRALTVTLDGGAVAASSGGSVTSTTPNSHVYDLTAGGTVVIYSGDGQIRFYTISYSNE